MKHSALQGAEKYMKAHIRKKRWYRVVTCLACVVVFCTTYALILPAITLENTGCEIPEHTHVQECYTQVTSVSHTEPVCTIQGLNIHQHNNTCYDSEGNLICRYANFVVHRHDSSCFDKDGNLWCTLPEIAVHQHTDSCYTQPEVHEHTADCYTLEQRELTCVEHVHTENCYVQSRHLTCGREESEGHQHNETCMVEKSVIQCGLEESPGHQHSESCMGENGEIQCGIAESQGHFHTESCMGVILEAQCGIAESEGHHHDDSCYEPTQELVCEIESDHQHTDACYAWERVLTCEISTQLEASTEPVLTCGEPEVILHKHTADCSDGNGYLICGMTQVLEHRHTDTCFETVQEAADTESLTCTLPEDETHTHTALCYGTWELTCNLEEHTHTEECCASEEQAEDYPVMQLDAGDSDEGIMLQTETPKPLTITSITGSGTKYVANGNYYSSDLRIEFALTKNEIDTNTAYIYTYPAGVIVPDDLLNSTKNLYDSSTKNAGTYTFVKNADGTYSVQIVFDNAYVAGAGDKITGYVQFRGELHAEKVEDGGSIKFVGEDGVTLEIPANSIEYPENETNYYDINVSKEGIYVQDGDRLVYTVYVHTSKGTPDPIQFKDVITTNGLTLSTPTVTVQQGYRYSYGSWHYDDQQLTAVTVTPSCEGGTITMSLPALKVQDTQDNNGANCTKQGFYKITYTYDITGMDASSVTPQNTVTVTATDTTKNQTITDTAKVDVNVYKDQTRTLDKTGEYVPEDGKIKWTITVNANNKDLTGFTLTDKMLVDISQGTEISIQPNTGFEWVYDTETDENGDTTTTSTVTGLTFTALEGAQTNNNQYTITYYTNAPPDTSTETPVTNKVELETPGGEKTEKPVTVTVGGYTLDKTGEYVPEDGKIKWTITLNQNRSDIAGATLEDAMFLGLTNTDFTIEPSGGFDWIIAEDGTITGIQFNAGENGTNTNSYTIRYSTEVESSGEAQTVSNTAIFDPNPGGDGEEVIGTGKVTVGGYTIDKSGRADKWNYNGTVTWTIGINSNRLDITNATLTDEMFAALKTGDFTVSPNSGFEWIYAVDGDGNKTDTITGMRFTAAEGEKNTNYYSISYTTSNPSSWIDQTIQNTAFFTPDGKDPISDDAEVTIPGKGSVSKSMDGAVISGDGSTAEITWTVTLDIPAGGLPAGTVIEDNVTQRDQWTVNTNHQWMTRAQITAWATNMTWDNGAGATNVYTPSPMNVTFLASDGKTYNYSDISKNLNGSFDNLTYTVFRITFADGLIPPEGATKLSFTYKTTADLTTAQPGENKYYNYVNAGGKETSAEYTYRKAGVVKMDGNWQTGTSNTSSDGTVTWMVKVTMNDQDNALLKVTDTLPQGVVLDGITLTGWGNVNMTLTIGEDGRISGSDSTYQVGGTYDANNRTITLTMTPVAENGIIQNNAEFTYTFTCHVDGETLEGGLESGKMYPLTNTVTAQTEKGTIGSSEQTQNWTYSASSTTNKVVDKSGRWDNDNRRVNYSVVLNPEGKDLLPDEEILTMTDTLTYTNSVLVWTVTGEFQEKYFNIEVTLIQNSVRLFRRNEDGSKGQEITDWTWLYSVSSAQNNPNSITNTITATGIPDSTPLILEYAYTVYSDIEKGWVINDLGISNTAKLEGVNNAQDSESSTKKWEDSSSSAGVTTDKTFTLYKVEEGNYNNGLSGAVFSVYAYDSVIKGYSETVVKTYTTNSNGMFQIKWSDGGYAYNTLYKVVETTPPTGYRLPDTVEEYYFYFSSETDTEHTLPENLPGVAVDLSKTDKTVYAENVNNMTKITVNKQWFSADGIEITGTKAGSVSFDLYRAASATPPSGGGGGGSTSGDVVWTFAGNRSETPRTETLVGVSVGDRVKILLHMNYSGSGWMNINWEGVSDGNGAWNGNTYEYTCTVTANPISISVNDTIACLISVDYEIIHSSGTGSAGGETPAEPAGERVGIYTISNTDGWTWTKGDLPLTGTDADGNTVYYTYYVEEHGVTNCTTAYENNGGIASGTIVIKNTESENPAYTLPETGGAGTTPYTMGGFLLMTSAALLLLYNHFKRRKEDVTSS